MALSVFPSLLGLAWGVTKTPTMKTRTLEAASGVEYRAQQWSYPRYQFSLPFQFLRQGTVDNATYDDWQTLVGFILEQAGMFNNFAYSDPTANQVTAQALGAGNASQVAFPLVQSTSGFAEPVGCANAVANVYLNGVNQSSGWTLTQTGYYGPDTITFGSAPGSGVAVTATFTFYYVCRFMQDDPEFELFMQNRWSCKEIKFQSVK